MQFVADARHFQRQRQRSVGAKVGTTAQHAPLVRRPRPGRVLARLLAPLVFIAIAAAVALIVSPVVSGRHPASHRSHAAVERRLPPYWTVRNGDTLAEVSARTGLSVALLESYNPAVNPFALSPGERLNLWQHPPHPAKPKSRPGPMFWAVKPGQSFGSIAASTGINITRLEQLNPDLKASSLQPGDRVRLRH